MKLRTNIRVARRCERSARPELVIALHCSGAGAGQWRQLGEMLGAGYELVAPEHYGCDSIGPWTGEHAFTLADEARKTIALIDDADEKVHLVGHSFGGGVALHVAVERPDRIASLSLYEPSAFHLLRQLGSGEAAAAFAEIDAVARKTGDGVVAGDYRGAASFFVGYWGGGSAWEGLRPSLQAALVRWMPKGPLDFAALINEPTPAAAYARLHFPVLIMRGENAPPPTRVIAEALPTLMPDAILAVVAGAGHMGPLTHAAEINATIARHIADTDVSARTAQLAGRQMVTSLYSCSTKEEQTMSMITVSRKNTPAGGRKSKTRRRALLACLSATALASGLPVSPAQADETCISPYMQKITGHEDYVYVWTLGVEGMGDGFDKLVTVDVRENSPSAGKVIDMDSVGSRNEAHHGGFTDDRRQFWAAGLDTSKIFIFDVASDPANPKLVKMIEDFEEKTGGVGGPHGAYALPGRMMIPALSNKDGTGRTAIVEYSNDGEFIATHWIPTAEEAKDIPGGEFADGYGYDVRVLPRKNVMLTSSFAGHENYMRPFGEVAGDPEAMKKFGNSMILWDFHARTPKKVFHVPGVPLEVRWAWGEDTAHAFTSTALTSQIWLVHEDENGEWQAKAVADIGDPSKLPVPVDISLSSDDRTLFANTFMDGMTRVFDVSDPHNPKQIYEQKIGEQVNMVSQSWDGERLYYTSSLLANWDKTGDANEQFLKAYHWDGEKLTPRFEIDFTEQALGRPHMMAFGAASLYAN